MGNAGRVLAIIGAAVGIAGVLLGLVIPILFSWYHVDLDLGLYGTGDLYLTGLGTAISDPSGSTLEDEIAFLVLIGGIMILVGAGLCIVNAATEMKVFGIIGGILMIVGPVFLIVDLLSVGSDFAEAIDNTIEFLESAVGGNYNPIWDSWSQYGYSASWGINWIGFSIPIAGGILGLIGGATT